MIFHAKRNPYSREDGSMEYIVQEKTGAAIQQAIEHAAAAGGGRVILEPGTYLSATLILKSNVELHLSAGARLLGLPDPSFYDEFRDPGFDEVVPEDSRKCLISCRNAENISITGLGTVDGSGASFFNTDVPAGQVYAKPSCQRPRMVQFYHCRNLLFEDVTFTESPNWTFWLIDCEDVRISRIRITGSMQIPNLDGIDLDSCRRVTVSDCFIRTQDDCIVLRAIRRDKTQKTLCENVNVSNCLLESRCTGIKIGGPSDDTIRNCIFSDLQIVSAVNGISCQGHPSYVRVGCTGYLHVSGIRFNNIGIESGHHPIRLFVASGMKLRSFSAFHFNNVRVKGKKPIVVVGCQATPLENISFAHVSGEIMDNVPLETKYVRGLRLEDVELNAATGASEEFVRPESWSWESRF